MIQAVILASDETHLTNFSGSKVFHALYMTLGNIYGHIRRQPQSGAWVLLAILPSSSFTQTLLNLTSPQSYVKLNKNEAASLVRVCCRWEIEITREEIYSTHTTKKAGYVVERDRPRYI